MGVLPDINALTEKQKELDNLTPYAKSVLNYDYGHSLSTDYNLVNEFNETGWVGDFHLDKVLTEAVLQGASDIHITTGQQVAFTILGDIVKCPEYPIPDEDVMQYIVNSMLNHQSQSVFVRELDFDFAYKIKFGPLAGARFRANVGISFDNYFLVFRAISEIIPSLEDLAVEQEIRNWAKLPSGLVLICGATGTGKSTTLASVLRDIQLNESKKIITIEKPIEYIYDDTGKSLVVQRDVGTDVLSFYSGLTAAMRQNPDIILLGEVRNTEEVQEFLRAGETGHLGFSTMHTNSVATTINRIQSLFSGTEQQRIMSTLGDTLRGVGNQVLVKDGMGGRFAVREILTVNDEVKELIRNGDIPGIRAYQRKHKITMEDKLAEAVSRGKCSSKEAFRHTAYPQELSDILEERYGISV